MVASWLYMICIDIDQILVRWQHQVVFFFVMGVFMLPITVKCNDFFSLLDSRSTVLPFVLSLSVVA